MGRVWLLLLVLLSRPAACDPVWIQFLTDPPNCTVSLRSPSGNWELVDQDEQSWELDLAPFRGHRNVRLRFAHAGYHSREEEIPLQTLRAGRYPPTGERLVLDPLQIKAVFHTRPSGAAVHWVTSTGETYLGRSGEELTLNLGKLIGQTQSSSFTLVFKDLPGYHPREVAIPAHYFGAGTDRWPEQGAAGLDPVVPAVVPAAYFVRDHPLASLLAGFLLTGGLVGIWLPRRREHARALERARRLESLQARSRGEESLVGRRLNSGVGALRIMRELGRGGMARVYEGRPDASLDSGEAVAVKVLEIDPDSQVLERFRREVQVLQELENPNIVRLHDWHLGDDREPTYLVMELVEGSTLRKVLEMGPLSRDRMLSLLGQLFEGVHFAHTRGVVHRDLKPENIMVRKDDQVKIMDFGLARAHDLATVTATGTALGTPAYMAPEQFQENWDARCDQYALGIIVFEMLCGRRPFEAEDPLNLALQHLTRPAPPLRDFLPDCPAELEAVVARMLSKNPDERFTSVHDAWKAICYTLPGEAECDEDRA